MAATFLVSHTARHAYRSIASALQAAASHWAARVEIEPGQYNEALTVRGDIELAALGSPGSVIISSGNGPVVEALGAVRLAGLALIGSDGDTVRCGAGTLTIEGSQIHGHGGPGLHAVAGTSVTLRDCVLHNGRAVFAGSFGLVERCRFADATNNAIAAIERADIRVQDSWIGHSRIHGVLVSGSRAAVTGCELTGTGNSSIAADKQAELHVANCRITTVHDAGVSFHEQSRGLLEGTVVRDAEFGVAVSGGANPIVRGCTFIDCRDSGINIHTKGLGRFEHCEVVRAGDVAVFSTSGGSPEVDGCRISGGNVGIAVVNGRGRFARCEIRDLTNAALRVLEHSTAWFSGIQVTGCPAGLDARGDAGTKVELTNSHFRGFSQVAVAALKKARVTLRNCTAQHGMAGFAAGGEAQLLAYDCHIDDTEAGGAIVYEKGYLTAERLTVTRPGSFGLRGQDSAYFEIQDSEFADARYVGVSVDGSAGGRLTRCSVTGSEGVGVVDNGRVQLIDLRSALPVTEQAPELPSHINYIFNGPVFNDKAEGLQLAWGNENVSQQQGAAPQPEERTTMPESGPTRRPEQPAEPGTHTYHGPVFNAEVKGAQLAWNNTRVTQNQQIAPGFEEVARIVTDLLNRLPILGLPEPDARDAAEHGRVVLAEVARPEPDRGIVRRGLTAIKGALAELAAGLVTGANAGAVEVGKDLVRTLGHLGF